MIIYLCHIIAALHIQVLKSDGVLTKKLISINRNKIDAKEATKIVCSRSGRDSAQVLTWIQNSKFVPKIEHVNNLRRYFDYQISWFYAHEFSCLFFSSYPQILFWSKYFIWIATNLRKLLTCSTTRAKWLVDDNPSLSWSESITSWTVVELSYLNDFVWPFSRNTFNTFGMSGCTESWEVIWLCVLEDGWNQKQ